MNKSRPQVQKPAKHARRTFSDQARIGGIKGTKQHAAYPAILFNPLAQQLLRLGKRREAAEAKLEKRLGKQPKPNVRRLPGA